MAPPLASSESGARAASPLPAPHRFYGQQGHVFEVTLHEPDAAPDAVPEALVQDLWAGQGFERAGLRTPEGQALTVLHPGTVNRDSGPDFLGAHLCIGEVEWRGDVEVHLRSGQWVEHGHDADARYNGVVLHVVLRQDLWTGGLRRADGSLLPELVLYPYLQRPLRELLHAFRTRPPDGLPCAAGWGRVPAPLREAWLHALAAERLQEKQHRLGRAYLSAPDLEQLLHEQLLVGLGYSKNGEAMRTLARHVPLALARRVQDPLDLEALHLGAAGLLPAPAELLQSDPATARYAMDLRDRFERLQHRFSRPVMARTAWHFFRLRPANFPPLRIAQAAALLRADPPGLLHHDPLGTLVRLLRTSDPLPALRRLLGAEPGPFWRTHVRLEKATRERPAGIGAERTDALLVNAVVPVLLLHAEQTADAALEAAVYGLLGRLPAAGDEVTRRFAALGPLPRDARTAQGLHQLYRTRCTEGRCLSCAVGRYLLEHP